MRVLVTGGSGFVGSHVVDSLLAAGHEPRILDLVPSPRHGRGEVDLVVANLLDRRALVGALRGCEAVVHLAAVSDVADVLRAPARAHLVNAGGTLVLLEAARAAAVPRVVYASTIWVYGGAAADEPLGEDDPLPLPTHLYTATKLAGEMYCRSYADLYGLEQTTLRFGIPYGPRARRSTVLAAFVDRALAGRAITIAGDGSQSRQFVYAPDLADGVVAALAPVGAGRTYKLVGSERIDIRTVAELVRDEVAPVPIVYVTPRAADLEPAVASGARAARELGWRASTSFAVGVRRYVESLTRTAETPSAATASRTAGSAPAVLRHEPDEL